MADSVFIDACRTSFTQVDSSTDQPRKRHFLCMSAKYLHFVPTFRLLRRSVLAVEGTWPSQVTSIYFSGSLPFVVLPWGDRPTATVLLSPFPAGKSEEEKGHYNYSGDLRRNDLSRVGWTPLPLTRSARSLHRSVATQPLGFGFRMLTMLLREKCLLCHQTSPRSH